MAPHSSTLAWKIPWTEEPGTLQSMGSLGVGQDWATLLLLFTFMHWRRKWQPTPVFLPGEPQGLRGLVGCLSMVFWKHSRLLICLHWDELCTVLCHWSVSDLDFCFLVLHTYECCLTYCLVGAIYNCLATNEACVKMKPITYSYQFFY